MQVTFNQQYYLQNQLKRHTVFSRIEAAFKYKPQVRWKIVNTSRPQIQAAVFEFKIITLSFSRFCHCHNTTKKQEWKKAKTLHASENSNALEWFQNWTDMSPLSLRIISWLAHYHIITRLVKKVSKQCHLTNYRQRITVNRSRPRIEAALKNKKNK